MPSSHEIDYPFSQKKIKFMKSMMSHLILLCNVDTWYRSENMGMITSFGDDLFISPWKGKSWTLIRTISLRLGHNMLWWRTNKNSPLIIPVNPLIPSSGVPQEEYRSHMIITTFMEICNPFLLSVIFYLSLW